MSRRDERSVRRRHTRIGLAGIGVAVVLAVICAVAYVNPLTDRTVTIQLTSSGGLRTGDEVRIAGVRVGDVADIRLRPDRVDVGLRIDAGPHIGDGSSADVRLLTAIGGHYVALRPSGRKPLGDTPIPVDRTSVPYTLSDVIADSGKVIERVNGVTIADTLRKVDQALDGRPTAIRQIIADMSELTTAVGDRRTDLDAAFALTEEYIAELNTGRAKLVELLRLIGFVGAKAYEVKAEGVETVRSIGFLFSFVRKPVEAFTGTIEPPVQQVLNIIDTLRRQPARIDDLLAKLKSIVDEIAGALGMPGRGTGIDASTVVVNAPSITLRSGNIARSGLCVPSVDRRC
ncbi:MCE family protein [Gordonia sinesedis]